MKKTLAVLFAVAALVAPVAASAGTPIPTPPGFRACVLSGNPVVYCLHAG